MAADKSAKKTSGKAGRNGKNFDYYAVAEGRNTGIFTVWDLCHASVDRYLNNIYKGFEDVEQAVDYLQDHGITEDDIAIHTTTNIRHGHSLQQLRVNAQQHGDKTVKRAQVRVIFVIL